VCRNELAALEVPDLCFEPEGVAVQLRRSKGDQKEKGLRRHPAWHGRAIRRPKVEHKLAERMLSEASVFALLEAVEGRGTTR
jgi:hypothetical protein